MITDMMQDNRVRFVIAVMVVLVLGFSGWYAYRAYRTSMNERAQRAFATSFDQFEKVAQDNKVASWEAVSASFAQEYTTHAQSDLAPFFKAFQAEALWRAGKLSEAITALEDAMHLLSSSNPFFYLYKTKLAIMQLHTDPVKGKQALQGLADDIHNPHKGLALYELWFTALVAQDQATAERLYAKLMAYQQQGAQWGLVAQAQLACNA